MFSLLSSQRLHAAELLTIQNSLRAVLSKAKAAGLLRMAFHDAGTYDMEDHSGFHFRKLFILRKSFSYFEVQF